MNNQIPDCFLSIFCYLISLLTRRFHSLRKNSARKYHNRPSSDMKMWCMKFSVYVWYHQHRSTCASETADGSFAIREKAVKSLSRESWNARKLLMLWTIFISEKRASEQFRLAKIKLVTGKEKKVNRHTIHSRKCCWEEKKRKKVIHREVRVDR